MVNNGCTVFHTNQQQDTALVGFFFCSRAEAFSCHLHYVLCTHLDQGGIHFKYFIDHFLLYTPAGHKNKFSLVAQGITLVNCSDFYICWYYKHLNVHAS